MTEIDMIIEMMEMQKVLDNAIYTAKNVEYDESKCVRAIIDEIGELNHELKSEWAWWKDTVGEVDEDKVLEELVDIWHFVLSRFNHTFDRCLDSIEKANQKVRRIKRLEEYLEEVIFIDYHRIGVMKTLNYDYDKRFYLFVKGLIEHPDCIAGLSSLIGLTSLLEFPISEVFECYKKKNKVNFDRLNSGY